MIFLVDFFSYKMRLHQSYVKIKLSCTPNRDFLIFFFVQTNFIGNTQVPKLTKKKLSMGSTPTRSFFFHFLLNFFFKFSSEKFFC